MLAALLLASAAPSQASAQARLLFLDRQAQAQEAELAAAQQPLARLLAAAERLALRPPALALVRREQPAEILRTRALIAGLAPAIRQRTARLRQQMIATAGARAAAEQALAALMALPDSAVSDQSQRVLARLAATPAPPLMAPPAGRHPVYRLPAAGWVVVGMGEPSVVGVRARGLTLATAPDAAIVAPAAARIAYAGPFRGYGDIVILDHGHGWTTLLAGLTFATVTAGDQVGAGAPIGRMGAAAPRLTIELRHQGEPVDVAAMALQ